MEIIAELGASHNQDYQTALELVFAAQEAGADTIKVQMFTADQMTSKDGGIIPDGSWAGQDLHGLYAKAAMPVEFAGKLKKLAEKLNMGFIVSVYHPDMVKTAEEIGVQRYKIASYELPWTDLIKSVAKTKKPLIMSVGMADYKEIELAVKTARNYHNDITLLWCLNKYPADVEQMNLATIPVLARAFGCKSGLSDHTQGYLAPVMALSLGASVLEKHLQINGGLDSSFALLPTQFKAMTEIVRSAEKAMGQATYGGEKKLRRKKVKGRWIRTV